ncbi:hypothetical protein E2320_012140, partial [Naja naja]
ISVEGTSGKDLSPRAKRQPLSV